MISRPSYRKTVVFASLFSLLFPSFCPFSFGLDGFYGEHQHHLNTMEIDDKQSDITAVPYTTARHKSAIH